MPPALAVGNTGSLGERIQRAFPRARVVKSLDTVDFVTPETIEYETINQAAQAA